MALSERLLEPDDLQGIDEPRLLVDVGSADRHARMHIPGAVLVTPGELVDGTPPATGRLPDVGRLQALVSRLGLTPEHEVIVYDDEGGGWAGRFIWTLEVLGHQRWRYLDGGLHAWHGAGLPLSDEPVTTDPIARSVSIDRAAVAEAEDVLLALQQPDTLIWDARSAEEYRGERVAAQRAGHIPGAVNLDWLELMDPDRDLRLRTDLADLLAARGIQPDRRIITHCQTHHRSGLTWLAARLLDYPRVQAYHGSWSEWGNLPNVPIQTGAEP